MKTFQDLSLMVIPAFMVFAVVYGSVRKVKVYDSFIDGAKDGLGLTAKIFPYILAVMVAVRVFQSSGAFDILEGLLSAALYFASIPAEALGVAIVRPLSGSAAIAVFSDVIKTTGADSMAARMSAVIMGSNETTFYVLAVYLGAAQIRKTAYLVPACIAADIAGFVAAVAAARLFFG